MAGGLDWVIFEGPFQHKPISDSVKSIVPSQLYFHSMKHANVGFVLRHRERIYKENPRLFFLYLNQAIKVKLQSQAQHPMVGSTSSKPQTHTKTSRTVFESLYSKPVPSAGLCDQQMAHSLKNTSMPHFL